MSDTPDQPQPPQGQQQGGPGYPQFQPGYTPQAQPYVPSYPPNPQYPAPGQLPQPGYTQPVYPYQPGYTAPGQYSNGMGVAALVVGIVGLVFFWFPYVGAILGILGVIFGAIGIAKANRGEANNRGMAVAGLVCGIVAVLLDVVIIIAVVNTVHVFTG